MPHLCTERSEFMASANAPIASSASSACQVLFSIPTIADKNFSCVRLTSPDFYLQRVFPDFSD